MSDLSGFEAPLRDLAQRRLPEADVDAVISAAAEMHRERGGSGLRDAMLDLRAAIVWAHAERLQIPVERQRWADDPAPQPLESFDAGERRRRVDAALARLGRETPNAERHLRGVARRGFAASAAADRLEPAALARRLQRLRRRLESLLLADKVRP